MSSLKERLEELNGRLEGTAAMCLLADDGISVETLGGDGMDIEALAAELMTQARSVADVERALDVGTVRQMSLATDRYNILMGAVAPGYYLMVVLDKDVPEARARFEVRRAALLFEEELL